MAQAIEAVREAIADGVPGVLGIHIEGPYLNEKRRGVHDASKLRELDGDDAQLLARPHDGVTMVTLAPERITPQFIRQLATPASSCRRATPPRPTTNCSLR